MLDALLCSTLGTDERLKNQILRSREYKYTMHIACCKFHARDALVCELGDEHAPAILRECRAVGARGGRRDYAALVPVRGGGAVR